jgi:transposase InsO family protein
MDIAVQIATWPVDAPRGAVSRFCREYEVSRSWFYQVRARVAVEGVEQGLQRRRRSPDRSRLAIPIEIEEIAVRLRKELAEDGCDHGPITVRDRLLKLGIAAPSPATLSRIFTRRGMVVPEPQKRPRSSYRRFEAALVHQLWQLDAFEWPLLNGSPAVIFQLEDDHSRCLVASRAATGETSRDAIAVVDAGVAAYQVPTRLLTDNHVSLNPTRRGVVGQLVSHVKQLGVTPITGRPHHPQTQGKDERLQRTTLKWLQARPRAATLAELQTQLDAFQHYYNHLRGHQALARDSAGLLRTPAQAVAEDPAATPPTPPTAAPRLAVRRRPRLASRSAVVDPKGKVNIAYKKIQVGAQRRGQTVRVIINDSLITILDDAGQLIRTVTITADTLYYGNGQPRGGPRSPRSEREVNCPQ